MAKKMTQREFKEIFEAAGFNFNIWGWEGILNMVSSFEAHEAEIARDMGFDAAAEANQERADIIFKELDNRGYYDECKVG